MAVLLAKITIRAQPASAIITNELSIAQENDLTQGIYPCGDQNATSATIKRSE